MEIGSENLDLFFTYWNKPKGVVSTTADEYGRKNVVSLIQTTERIYPVDGLIEIQRINFSYPMMAS